jgi:hypothetical protein
MDPTLAPGPRRHDFPSRRRPVGVDPRSPQRPRHARTVSGPAPTLPVVPAAPASAARAGPGPAVVVPRARAFVPAIYGFDIETDTRVDGLDPGRSRIVAAALATPDSTVVFTDDDEAVLLDRLDWHIASLEPGVLATWNGSAFDLPFVADRARHHGLGLGLRLRLDPGIARRHPPLSGHPGAYRASWHSHAHLDGYQVFRADVSPALGVSGSLKSVARLCGLRPLQLDAAHLHRACPADVQAYVASDAQCARELVRRRWATARLSVDVPPSAAPLGPQARAATGAPDGAP